MKDRQTLRQVVEQQHECRATLRKVARVVESHQGETVWDGDVAVFDVDHTEASTAYAWADPVPGTSRLRYFAVLGKPPISNANDAVRAALAARFKEEDNA